jgi:hypothetical protein
MPSAGFTIVFSGPSFQRAEFAPSLAFERLSRCSDAMPSPPTSVRSDTFEFSDIREDYGGLDPRSEALDLLQAHRSEFRRLSEFPGITTRQLSITGSLAACTIELDAEGISLLHELQMHLSICPCL